MFPGARTKGVTVTAAAGNKNGVKVGPGTLVSISFVGAAGVRIDVYDGLTVATGTLVTSIHSNVACNYTPFLGFETGLSLVVVGAVASSNIGLVIE